MKSEKITVTGMSCDNCAAHVSQALTDLPGTANVKVDLKSGIATLDYDPAAVSVNNLIEAIEEEGYKAALSDQQ
jgi:copper chaperone CopZ